jgi:two-component system sensor histidine kinase/response regulator
MSHPRPPLRRRILVIDDNRAIHEDFRKILRPRTSEELALEQAEAEIFGRAFVREPDIEFDIESAYQGQEGHAKAQAAMLECDPHAVAFVDVQMPPGWDGIQTAERLWEVNPELQIVICTAYSNYSWAEIASRLGCSAQLLILKKPFDNIEVLQLALSLSEKWHLMRDAQFQRAELEHTVQERTRQLRAAKEAADMASSAKNEFLAMISHEIRTPMNGLIGLSDILAAEVQDPDLKDYARSLQASAQLLMKILSEILDFSQISAEGIQLQANEFSLADLLETVVEGVAAPAAQKRLPVTQKIAPGIPPILVGDEGRLRQVLGNLMDNAVKFTDRGEITLSVEVESQSAHELRLRFEVTDTGCGIPAASQKRLFQVFSQADGSLTRKYGGVGLGLAIAKRIVELTGGRIGFTTKEGVGTTFWFTTRVGPAPSALH